MNAKLIAWDNEIRTRFREGKYTRYIDEIPACRATGVLKISSVYRQGSKLSLTSIFERVQISKKEMSVLRVSLATTIATKAGMTRLTETLKNICEEVNSSQIVGRRRFVVYVTLDRWDTGRSGDFL